jgi:lysophospholipid acyltransferase (LPLAT)-like uncharacterized protein
MGLAKRIGKSEGLRGLLCWLGSLYIRFVHATSRWQVINGGHARALWESDQPFILAFWHGRILMMPKSWRGSVPIHMLISQHRDGQLIARTVSHFGIETVPGSTTRGGSAALRAMLKFLKSGQCVGITPDGPKGPRMRASSGIVNVAKLAGVPILPATFSTSRRRLLGSWDRFAVALPFSQGVFVWGDPITVTRSASEAELESARLLVEASLNAITVDADSRLGLDTPQPAESEAE